MDMRRSLLCVEGACHTTWSCIRVQGNAGTLFFVTGLQHAESRSPWM